MESNHIQPTSQEQILILFHSYLGDRGFVGLTEDEDKFRRWQICSAEVAKAVLELEDLRVL